MKIGIDKKTITLERLEEARNVAKENTWIDSTTVKEAAAAVLKRFHGDDSVWIESLLSAGTAAVTMNHYVSMDVYMTDVKVEYTYFGEPDKDGMRTHWAFAVLSFDMTDYLKDGTSSAFVQYYERTECRCC